MSEPSPLAKLLQERKAKAQAQEEANNAKRKPWQLQQVGSGSICFHNREWEILF